jgi:hypothetical protein
MTASRHTKSAVEQVDVSVYSVPTDCPGHRFGAPILDRGCSTSLAGQCCNVAVVIDCSKYLHGFLEIAPQRRCARVPPGTILDDLRHAAERHHLTLGPDPATHNHCTLGGMIGNSSCGVHSVMAGRTVDNVEALEVLTYDGLCLRAGRTDDGELGLIIREWAPRRDLRPAQSPARSPCRADPGTVSQDPTARLG